MINESAKEYVLETLSLLIKQGAASYSGVFCAYRDGKGNKCAIGMHIPDELYHPHMENYSLGEIVEKCHFPHNIALHKNLQTIHDYVATYTQDWLRLKVGDKYFVSLLQHIKARLELEDEEFFSVNCMYGFTFKNRVNETITLPYKSE